MVVVLGFQIESLQAAGLIKGGSLQNALVCGMEEGWVNPPLRFPNEPCRHKLLDLIGDLALCGKGGNLGVPSAHVVAYKVWVSTLMMMERSE